MMTELNKRIDNLIVEIHNTIELVDREKSNPVRKKLLNKIKVATDRLESLLALSDSFQQREVVNASVS